MGLSFSLRSKLLLTVLFGSALNAQAAGGIGECGTYQLTDVLSSNASATSLVLNPRTKSEQRISFERTPPEWNILDQAWVKIEIEVTRLKKGKITSFETLSQIPERVPPPAHWPVLKQINREKCRVD